MLPLSAILRFHKIGYHVYADDTQIYVPFKCDDPSQALDKINVFISDIRRCHTNTIHNTKGSVDNGYKAFIKWTAID